jgi:hypothetical protein
LKAPQNQPSADEIAKSLVNHLRGEKEKRLAPMAKSSIPLQTTSPAPVQPNIVRKIDQKLAQQPKMQEISAKPSISSGPVPLDPGEDGEEAGAPIPAEQR